MRRPSPGEYGLCDDFDKETYKAEAAWLTKQADERTLRVGWALTFALLAVFAAAYEFLTAGTADLLALGRVLSDEVGGPIQAVWFLFFTLALLTVPTTALASRVIKPGLDDRAEAFVRDFEAWEYHNAETGLGFWAEKRGIEFEQALMRLFAARGCSVQGTRGSSDGGVDIILRLGGVTWWCQCKGHAKPVSVGPVREIAGVCSNKSVHSAVFAVNGYTRAARETADDLGVQLFDAPEITALARRDRIDWL